MNEFIYFEAENFTDYEESSTVYIPGFENGFRVPAAIDSKNNVYHRRGFGYFHYQNIDDGPSSNRKIPGCYVKEIWIF